MAKRRIGLNVIPYARCGRREMLTAAFQLILQPSRQAVDDEHVADAVIEGAWNLTYHFNCGGDPKRLFRSSIYCEGNCFGDQSIGRTMKQCSRVFCSLACVSMRRAS